MLEQCPARTRHAVDVWRSTPGLWHLLCLSLFTLEPLNFLQATVHDRRFFSSRSPPGCCHRLISLWMPPSSPPSLLLSPFSVTTTCTSTIQPMPSSLGFLTSPSMVLSLPHLSHLLPRSFRVITAKVQPTSEILISSIPLWSPPPILPPTHSSAPTRHLLHFIKMSKSKLQCGINSHRSEWPSSKNLQTINAGEGVEKREPSYTVGGHVNWYSHYEEQYGGFLKN